MKKIILTGIAILTLQSTFSYAVDNHNIRNLIHKCTPKSHWNIVEKIVKVESGGSLFDIGINKKGYRSQFPKTITEARSIISELLSKKINFDIGLMQINSQHFKKNRAFYKKGFKAINALDPCTNLKMGSYILSEAYRRYEGDIVSAISEYNTGDPKKGIENGYLDKYR